MRWEAAAKEVVAAPAAGREEKAMEERAMEAAVTATEERATEAAARRGEEAMASDLDGGNTRNHVRCDVERYHARLPARIVYDVRSTTIEMRVR